MNKRKKKEPLDKKAQLKTVKDYIYKFVSNEELIKVVFPIEERLACHPERVNEMLFWEAFDAYIAIYSAHEASESRLYKGEHNRKLGDARNELYHYLSKRASAGF